MTGSPLDGIRLVALDLDGTLLPSSKRLTDRAVGVVSELRAAGIDVTLATGKGWNHTRRYAEELGLTAPLVALEGALVARSGADVAAVGEGGALRSRTLSPETLRRVHDTVDDLALGYFFCHEGGRTDVHRRLLPFLPQIRIWDPHTDLVEGCPSARSKNAFVLHLIGDPGRVGLARSRIEALDRGGVDLFRCEFWDGFEQLHVRPPGIGKHEGLQCVLDDLGVARGELMACGDWWNDVEMLRMAGVGVAPANAVAGVRDAADHVLPGTSEDDALVTFLEDALRRL